MMCSVQEEDELADFEQPKKILNSTNDRRDFSTCKKCEEKSVAVVLLHGKDPVCRSCFEVYCNHKFRSTIGKSKKLKPCDKVLIAYSGGLTSAAMVGLTEQALKDSANKKLKFIPAVLHIDETFITNSAVEDKVESCSALKELNWPILLSSLEMALRDTDDKAFYWERSSPSIIPDQSGSKELKCVLIKSLGSTKSLTAKLDYLKLLRTQLISDIAKHAGFNFVFCGDTCDDLAVELLCDIAMGRGSQISSDTNFYDARYQVPICRPLREFMKRELAFYNHLNNIPYEVHNSLITKTDSRMSVQRLTETFVCGLRENFPSTVHTIFKTGGKISSLSSDAVEPGNCIMCKSKLDNKDPDQCSALELLSVSSELSQNNETKTYFCQNNGSASGPSSCCCERNQACCSTPDRAQHVMSNLCHGCQITVEEMGLNKNLQPELLEVLKKRINRSKMKEEIQEFLLED